MVPHDSTIRDAGADGPDRAPRPLTLPASLPIPGDVVPVTTRAELVAATGADDAFARLDPPAALVGWVSPGAVAVLRTSGGRPTSVFAWGEDVGPLLDVLAPHLSALGVVGVSVPRAQERRITERFTVVGGGDWDWMWTTRLPAPIAGIPLVDLDDTRDADEITALAAENPRFEGFPGTGASEQWIGVRDDAGRLVACGAIQRLPSGVAHLGGILTASGHRRQGLGTTVTAALTARAVAADGVCTLGMYADNDAARSVYDALGYVVDKAWASRSVSLR
ncbi:GNAT family N-acetyltransferase [Mobilicoccus pelagius]|uniref:GNAT family N-acetyltransferase n=1 Tax=Mobilicoccus pelagius TaxID=746032 RepID=UPI0002FC0B13|nr:GNAT family N-acetyltransferase [Mobilicoccus pelagius]